MELGNGLASLLRRRRDDVSRSTAPPRAPRLRRQRRPCRAQRHPRRGATWAIQDEAQLIDNWDDLLIEDEDDEAHRERRERTPDRSKSSRSRRSRSTTSSARAPVAQPCCRCCSTTTTRTPTCSSSRRSTRSTKTSDGSIWSPATSSCSSLSRPTRAARSRSATRSPTAEAGSRRPRVTVTIRGDDENSRARNRCAARTPTVAAGGRVTTQVLGDWVDPDGDAFYLTSASTGAPDQVSHKPDGVVVFTDSGQGRRPEGRDPRGHRRPGRVDRQPRRSTVSPAGQLPITVEPWVALVTAGQEITVRPMPHVTRRQRRAAPQRRARARRGRRSSRASRPAPSRS